eukprot:5133155-Pyramimonas_sp.AAC.1
MRARRPGILKFRSGSKRVLESRRHSNQSPGRRRGTTAPRDLAPVPRLVQPSSTCTLQMRFQPKPP